jgi:hypothetical protein
MFHGYAPTAPGQAFYLGLEVRKRLPGDGRSFEMECKTQECTGLCASHFALVPVHLYLKVLFKERGDAHHHALTGPLRLYQNDKVVGVPAELMAPFLQFLIEVVQKDVAEERR